MGTEMKQDMTKGSISRNLVRFTVPLILSGLLQQIFNWVDAFIVGNVNGEPALAGIGSVTSLYYLFVTMIIGATSGISVMTGQKFGSNKKEEIHKILSTFTVVLTVTAVVVAGIGIGLCSRILHLLNTPESILPIGRGYLQIVLLGAPFLAIYNTYSAVLRGMGDSRAPFMSVMVCSLVNVVLDLFFVVGLKKGAPGAALATTLSQIAMTVFVVMYAVRKYELLRFRLDRTAVDSHIISYGLAYIIPPAIQSGVSSMGNLVLQRFMNGFGQQTVAAITTAYRVDTVILLPIINFGSGIATVVAQNIGAGKEKRARRTLRVGAAMTAVISLLLAGVVIFFGRYLIAMFGLTEESVQIGASFFRSIGSFYVIYGLAMAVRGYIEGRGNMLYSGVVGIGALGVRIAASYLFADVFGNMVIAYAEGFSWLVLLIVLGVRAGIYTKGAYPDCG